MSRIADAFKNGKAFIPFITAGDPDLSATKEFILTMEKAGADLIEIGIPFSDPIAEGVVIQEADIRALSSGTTTDKVFAMVREVRQETDMPLVFMTYLNPVFHYGRTAKGGLRDNEMLLAQTGAAGYERFFARCEEVGINGIIIPDMPFEEKGECEKIALAHGVEVVSMIAPTSENRIKSIAGEAKGFIYVVSSMGVTGVRSEITTDLRSIIATIRDVTDVPAAVGFGINTPAQAKEISQYADGVIVGSAIVKLVAKYGKDAAQHIYEYVRSMKEAIS